MKKRIKGGEERKRGGEGDRKRVGENEKEKGRVERRGREVE